MIDVALTISFAMTISVNTNVQSEGFTLSVDEKLSVGGKEQNSRFFKRNIKRDFLFFIWNL